MLAHARKVRGVAVLRGVAEALPFRDRSLDLVFFHLSLHHTRWKVALAEAVRVRRRGGRIEVWTFGEAHHATSFLGAMFPEVAALDRLRFPAPDRIAATLEASGLAVSTETVVEPVERSVAFWEEGIRGRFVSTLQALDDARIEAALDAFRRRHPHPDEVIASTLTFERLVARD